MDHEFQYQPYAKTCVTRNGKKYSMKLPEYVTPALFCELIDKRPDSFMQRYHGEIPYNNEIEMVRFREAIRWYCFLMDEQASKAETTDDIARLKQELLKHRVRLQKAKAIQQELKAKEMKGKIVTTTEMSKDISEIAVLFKKSLEDLPGTLAITLAQKPAGFIKNQLTKEINKILNDISEKIEQL